MGYYSAVLKKKKKGEGNPVIYENMTRTGDH